MADVASSLAGWSATASGNAPAGATLIGTGMDDNLREIQAVVRAGLATVGANIASASTTDIGAVSGLTHLITGTTTISGLGTVSSGIWKVLVFQGVLTLTHNATSLILPGGANIITAAGDVAIVQSEGSGNWRCISYTRASGRPVIQLPQLNGITAITGNTTLVAADGYRLITAGGGGTYTVQMPDSATIPDGWYVRILNTSSVLTIQRSASDNFVGGGLSSSGQTTFTMPYTGAAALGYNTGAVTLTKFGTTYYAQFDSASHGIQFFTSNGSWTCPLGVNTAWISGCAAGGGGGGANATGAGGGGGGGSSRIKNPVPVVPGTTYTVTVPNPGGAGGTAGGGNGGNGGSASFDVLLSMSGGIGGTGGVGTGAVGGAGGSGGGGARGADGYVFGPGANIPGHGGGCIWGAHAGVSPNGLGADGPAFGAGSGGGGGNNAGGAGGAGLIIVEW